MSLPFYLSEPGPHWYDGRLPWYSLDLETTNLDKGDPRNAGNRIVLTCIGNSAGTRLYDDGALERLTRKPCILVCHNAKFESGWMHRYKLDLRNCLMWDTMLAEYVIAGNRGWDVSLDAVAQRYGMPGKEAAVDTLIKSGVCPSVIPDHWLEARVRYDVQTTYDIARKQYEILKEKGLLAVFFTRCIVSPVLAAIEFEGMHLDPARVAPEFKDQTEARAVIEGELAEITGGINMRSRPQLATFLYDTLKFDEILDSRGEPKRTKTGQRMTKADFLLKLKADTTDQRKFLKAQKAFAKTDARLSKYLQFFKGACDQFKGFILGKYNQAVTATHRLSATAVRIETEFGERGAQFMNMPREYKRLFCASALGRVICELDYAQLEFRVAVELAHDVQGMKDIASGHDVHKFTASVLKRKPMDEVTKEERQAAKPDTFKPLYFGQSGTPRQKAYYAAFRERYPQIAAMQEGGIAEALRTKEQRTASGLIYYWPHARMSSSGYVTDSPSICNYPIQAFATADIVLIGLAYLYWRLKASKADARIINTVHDSVILDMVATFDPRPLAQQALVEDVVSYVRDVYGRGMAVPLSTDCTVGTHWGESDASL